MDVFTDRFVEQQLELTSGQDGSLVRVVLVYNQDTMLPELTFLETRKGNGYTVTFLEDDPSTHFVHLHEFVKFHEQILHVQVPMDMVKDIEHFLLLRREAMWLPETDLTGSICSDCGYSHSFIHSYWLPNFEDGVLRIRWMKACGDERTADTWPEALTILTEAAPLDETGAVTRYLQSLEAHHLVI